MPYKIRKLPGREAYRVYRVDEKTGKAVETKAKETSLVKAKALIRLLHGVEHGWRPSKGGR